MTKTLKIWVGVNGNGFVCIHAEQPHRDDKNRRWISTAPFCNSLLQEQLEYVIKKANLTWNDDIEYFEIPIEA